MEPDMSVDIYDWSVVEIMGRLYLHGRVVGHPDHIDNSIIVTTQIVDYKHPPYSLNYKNVITKSGREYFLHNHKDKSLLEAKFGSSS